MSGNEIMGRLDFNQHARELFRQDSG